MAALATKSGLADLTADLFRNSIGETFVFRRPEGQQAISAGRVELKLIDVESFDRHLAEPAVASDENAAQVRIPFSLLFELGNDIPVLGPGLHCIEHPDFLPEEWHIARVQVFVPDSKKAYYESVFG